MLGGCHPIVTEVFSILWNAIGPSGGRGLSAEDIKHNYKNYLSDFFFNLFLGKTDYRFLMGC